MNLNTNMLARLGNDCVVCQAFPGHHGPHYTRRDLTGYMFAHRSQRPGKGGWMPLDGAFSPDGNQIMMSTRMPADLDSMEVDGIWLMEHKEQVEGEPQAAGAGPRMSAPNRPSFLSGWLSPR